MPKYEFDSNKFRKVRSQSMGGYDAVRGKTVDPELIRQKRTAIRKAREGHVQEAAKFKPGEIVRLLDDRFATVIEVCANGSVVVEIGRGARPAKYAPSALRKVDGE